MQLVLKISVVEEYQRHLRLYHDHVYVMVVGVLKRETHVAQDVSAPHALLLERVRHHEKHLEMNEIY